jgi:hypothetical protein
MARQKRLTCTVGMMNWKKRKPRFRHILHPAFRSITPSGFWHHTQDIRHLPLCTPKFVTLHGSWRLASQFKNAIRIVVACTLFMKAKSVFGRHYLHSTLRKWSSLWCTVYFRHRTRIIKDDHPCLHVVGLGFGAHSHPLSAIAQFWSLFSLCYSQRLCFI